jgi:putative DNA primase/helicase
MVYGSAGPEFVRLLLAEGVSGEDVRRMVEDFVKAEVPCGADGQIIRAAQRFGLIAAAGELATQLGVTGWRASEARGGDIGVWQVDRGTRRNRASGGPTGDPASPALHRATRRLSF